MMHGGMVFGKNPRKSRRYSQQQYDCGYRFAALYSRLRLGNPLTRDWIQFNIIMCLRQAAEEVRYCDCSDLSAYTGRARMTTRRALKDMRAAGVIETIADPQDRRRTCYQITRTGAARWFDFLESVNDAILEAAEKFKNFNDL